MIGQQISATELNELIKKGLSNDEVIIDVRTPNEYAKGKISGALNIPVDTILAATDKLKNYKKIYIYCLSGGRSQLAIALLKAQKFPVELCDLTSGLLAWRKGGYPLQ